MIQSHQFQILVILGQIPVCGDLQLSAICKLDFVHVLLNSPDTMPQLLHRSGEKTDQSSQARLHVGKRLVVIQAKVIQVLEQVEHHPARFLGVADRRFQFEACPFQFRIGERLLVQPVVVEPFGELPKDLCPQILRHVAPFVHFAQGPGDLV